jgi:hypothetical protein
VLDEESPGVRDVILGSSPRRTTFFPRMTKYFPEEDEVISRG